MSSVLLSLTLDLDFLKGQNLRVFIGKCLKGRDRTTSNIAALSLQGHEFSLVFFFFLTKQYQDFLWKNSLKCFFLNMSVYSNVGESGPPWVDLENDASKAMLLLSLKFHAHCLAIYKRSYGFICIIKTHWSTKEMYCFCIIGSVTQHLLG